MVTSRALAAGTTRGRIVAAAARVISARGVADSRLIDVARAAGVSIGNVQHYFATREDLLAAAFDAVNDSSISDWEAMASKEPGAPGRLSAMLRLAALGRPGQDESGWALWVEFWALAKRNARFRAEYDIIYAKWRGTLVRAVADGAESGQFRPRDSVRDTVDRLTAVIEGLAIRSMLDPTEMPGERVFELVVRAAELELECSLPR